jgi:hypothetical protein
VPLENEKKPDSPFGLLKDTIIFVGDITSPIEVNSQTDSNDLEIELDSKNVKKKDTP